MTQRPVRPEHKGRRIRHERAFPGRYDWLCPECGDWHRYFELSCPEAEREFYESWREAGITP